MSRITDGRAIAASQLTGSRKSSLASLRTSARNWVMTAPSRVGAVRARYASSRLACSTRRSLATIWCCARTDVTACDEVAGAGDDQDGARPLDHLHFGEIGQQPVLDRRRGTEAEPLLRVDSGDDARWGVERDDPAAVEDGDAVREALRLLHEVGDEEDGDAAVTDRLDELPRVAAGLRVEARRQLVEDRDLRLADEGERDREALLLPAGEVPVGGVALLGQAQLVDERASIGRVARRRRRRARPPPPRSCGRGARSPGAGRRRPRGGRSRSCRGSSPSTRIVPLSGVRRPAMASTVVVLPAPFGPRMPKISPSSTEKDTSSTARVLAVVLGECGDFDDVHASSIATAPPHGVGEVAVFSGVVG